MRGGLITGNTNSGSGGGVYVDSGFYDTGSLTMSGGARISGNTAANGGGVYMCYGASLTMSGGEISGNTANVSGGGVYGEDASLYSRVTRLTMSQGAVISNNTAASGDGGGVWMPGTDGDNAIIMNGGVISGNTAGGKGGGVACVDVYMYAAYTDTPMLLMNGGTIYGSGAGADVKNTSTGSGATFWWYSAYGDYNTSYGPAQFGSGGGTVGGASYGNGALFGVTGGASGSIDGAITAPAP